MTKVQTIHMTSTPVFTLFIQLFQIDTDGCMKVIGERKTKQSELLLAIRGKSQQPQQASSSLQKSSGCLPMKGKETQRKSAASKMKDLPENARPGPVVLPSLGPKPKPKTVSELLREKRLRESRANKALENTVILAPQVLVTPPVILQQPLQPLLPSSLSPAQPLGSRSAGKPVAMASSPTATFQTSSPIITSTKSPEKNSITNNSGSSLGNEVIVEESINKTEGTSAPQVGVLVSGQSSSLMRAEGHCVPRESPVPRTTTNQALGVNQISTSSGPASLLSSQVTTTSGNQELPKASPFLAPAQISMQQPKPISLVPTLSVPTCGPQVISSNILPITWVVTAQGLVPVSMSTLVGLPGPGKPAGTPVLPILGGVAKSQATLKLLPSSTVKQSPGAPEPSPSVAKRPLIASKTVQGDVASGTAGPSLPTHLPTTASSHTVSHSEKSNLPGDKPSFGGGKTAGEMSAPSPQPETQSQTKSPTNQLRAEPDDCYCASTPEAESPAGVNIGGQDSTQKGLLLETKDSLPFQNGDPEKSFPILTGTPKPITQSQEGMAAQDNQPKALEPGKSVLDLNLLSLENEASVREWLKGGKGVCLPQLQSTLPYLPPFLCNLKTLSGLLLQKKSLEQTAATMVAQGRVQDKNDVSRQDVQAARHLVQQQLKENPAYLLLKARFLAAFALPAFLATLSPPRVSTTLSRTNDRNNVSEEEKEEECSQSETRAKDRDCGGNEQLTNTTGDTQSTPGTMSSMQGSPHPVPNAQMSGILDAADFNVLKTRNAVHARKRRRV